MTEPGMHHRCRPAAGLLALLLFVVQPLSARALLADTGHAEAGRADPPRLVAARTTVPGESVSGVLEIAGKQVPLPRGPWLVLASGVQPAAAADQRYGVIRSVLLLARDGDAIRGLLEVNTNDIPVSGGWVAPCGNDPLPALRRLRYRSQFDASCAEVGATLPDAAGPPVWQAARAAMLQAGLHLPATLLTATALSADRQDFVEARIHLPPQPGVDGTAQEQALLDWAAGYAALLEHGITRRLDGLEQEWPGRAELLHEEPVLERRLLTLEAMRHDGAITPAEQGAQETAALAEKPMSAADPHPRTSLLNQITSPLINVATAYSVTRNLALSVAIGASEHVARQMLAYGNDERWTEIARAVMPDPSPMPELQHLGSPVADPGLLGLGQDALSFSPFFSSRGPVSAAGAPVVVAPLVAVPAAAASHGAVLR